MFNLQGTRRSLSLANGLCYFSTSRQLCQELFSISFKIFFQALNFARYELVKYITVRGVCQELFYFFRGLSSLPSPANFDSLPHLLRFVKNFFQRLAVPRALLTSVLTCSTGARLIYQNIRLLSTPFSRFVENFFPPPIYVLFTAKCCLAEAAMIHYNKEDK